MPSKTNDWLAASAAVALLIGPMLVVSSCGKPAEAVRDGVDDKPVYWVDERTDLCFARLLDYGRYVINVPCNDRVRQLAREARAKK